MTNLFISNKYAKKHYQNDNVVMLRHEYYLLNNNTQCNIQIAVKLTTTQTGFNQ